MTTSHEVGATRYQEDVLQGFQVSRDDRQVAGGTAIRFDLPAGTGVLITNPDQTRNLVRALMFASGMRLGELFPDPSQCREYPAWWLGEEGEEEDA